MRLAKQSPVKRKFARAMAQAVSRQAVIAEARVRFCVIYCGIYGG
jgi:hypothetical protein